MRIVIDCNVVVAAARIDGLCRRTLVTAIRDHEIILSEPIMDEYRDVCARRKHRAYQPILLTLIDLLDIVSLTVEPGPVEFGLQDPDDEVYLATAYASRAQALITGNIRDFSRRFYHEIEILMPSELLDRC
jgi:putative PIN family toxin of toxin-antitoxin system